MPVGRWTRRPAGEGPVGLLSVAVRLRFSARSSATLFLRFRAYSNVPYSGCGLRRTYPKERPLPAQYTHEDDTTPKECPDQGSRLLLQRGHILGRLEVGRYERSRHGNIGMNPTRRALFNECGFDVLSSLYGDFEIQGTETQVLGYGTTKSVAHFVE